MTQPVFSKPWRSLADTEAASFRAELKRECFPVHRLFWRRLRAIARHEDRDEVLFQDGDHPGKY